MQLSEAHKTVSPNWRRQKPPTALKGKNFSSSFRTFQVQFDDLTWQSYRENRSSWSLPKGIKILRIATTRRSFDCLAFQFSAFPFGQFFSTSHYLRSELIFKAELSDTENSELTTGHLGLPSLQLLTEKDPAASAFETEEWAEQAFSSLILVQGISGCIGHTPLRRTLLSGIPLNQNLATGDLLPKYFCSFIRSNNIYRLKRNLKLLFKKIN